MLDKIKLNKIEFYITNVCNLTCSGCNRYNNYKFSGWQDWNKYESIMEKWAEKIHIQQPVILGGEPLLNPTINSWLQGISRIWPTSYSPQIQSNGTRIDLVPGLYDTCVKTQAWIGISLHSLDDIEPIIARIRNYLQHPIKETQESNTVYGSNYQFIDKNGIRVHIWISDHFTQNNIIEGPNGEFRLYDSNPIIAHNNCAFVKFKNYHMIDGKIYKCGPAALMPKFDDQYPLEVSDEDKKLIHGYRGLSVDEFDERGKEFFRTIDDPIPQCKFCPESYDYKKITFSNLKPNKI